MEGIKPNRGKCSFLLSQATPKDEPVVSVVSWPRGESQAGSADEQVGMAGGCEVVSRGF